MIIFNCKNCGNTVSAYKSQKSQFCCLGCWYDYKRKQGMKKCEYCNKEFKPKDGRRRFCSKECVYSYQKTLVGEMSPKYNHVDIICEQCGNQFSVKRSKQGSARFCSRKCASIWYKQYQSSDNKKKIASKRIVNTMESGKMKKTLTKPHIKAIEILDELGIEYECEHSIKYYLVDIFLLSSGLMIEVMGDFWHSNPTSKYKDAKTIQQTKRLGKDKAKHSYAKNNYGVEILYLWEHDILNNWELCRKLIMQYVDNNGVLEDYNSYNYHLTDNDIEINNITIKPKFAS